jgi:hypothetical protein
MASTLPLIKEAVGTLPGSWIITLLRYEPMRKGEAAIGGSLHRAYACLVLAPPIWGIGRAGNGPSVQNDLGPSMGLPGRSVTG